MSDWLLRIAIFLLATATILYILSRRRRSAPVQAEEESIFPHFAVANDPPLARTAREWGDYQFELDRFEQRIAEQKRKHQSTKKIIRERDAFVRAHLMADVGFK